LNSRYFKAQGDHPLKKKKGEGERKKKGGKGEKIGHDCAVWTILRTLLSPKIIPFLFDKHEGEEERGGKKGNGCKVGRA